MKHLKIELKGMIERLEYLRGELDDAGLGMAARELDDASRALDMSISFIQESEDEPNED